MKYAKKIKWLTPGQIRYAALKSRKAALARSIEHWEQLVAASPSQLHRAYRSGKVNVMNDFCALCRRYGGNCHRCGTLKCNELDSLWRWAKLFFSRVVKSGYMSLYTPEGKKNFKLWRQRANEMLQAVREQK